MYSAYSWLCTVVTAFKRSMEVDCIIQLIKSIFISLHILGLTEFWSWTIYLPSILNPPRNPNLRDPGHTQTQTHRALSLLSGSFVELLSPFGSSFFKKTSIYISPSGSSAVGFVNSFGPCIYAIQFLCARSHL